MPKSLLCQHGLKLFPLTGRRTQHLAILCSSFLVGKTDMKRRGTRILLKVSPRGQQAGDTEIQQFFILIFCHITVVCLYGIATYFERFSNLLKELPVVFCVSRKRWPIRGKFQLCKMLLNNILRCLVLFGWNISEKFKPKTFESHIFLDFFFV